MITIVPYTAINKAAIKILNYEWLNKYFEIEPNDIVQLENPEAEIINKGGYIFYAIKNDEVIGTATLLKVSNDEYELAKMAVTEQFKNKGIGKLLMDFCLAFTKDLKIKKLILYSNTKLEAAIHLYKKYGFIEVPVPHHIHYKRCNIIMEKFFA